MNRQLGLPLAAGLLAALLFLSLAKGIALGVLLSYLAPLPLMMAGLALGQAASVIAGAVGMIAVGLVAGEISTLPFLATAAFPAWLVTNRALLRRDAEDGSALWYPPGHVLAWLTGAGILLILMGVVLVSGHPEGVKAWVADTIGRTFDLLAADFPPEARKRAVSWWTPVFPAMVMVSWLAMIVVNAAGAQGLLTRMGQARRPSPAYRQLMLPDWLAWMLAVTGLVAIAAEGDPAYVALNLAMVLLMPFVLLGLAGIHRWAEGRPRARLILAVTYGLLILAFGWAAMAVAGLGLVRFWTMRFRRPESGGGMEE